MKLAGVAVLALAATTGTAAQDTTLPRCATTMTAPWNLGSNPTNCNKEAAYFSIQYLAPTDAILARFCPSEFCRNMVSGVLPLRPSGGDCTVTRGGKQVPFFAEIVDVFADKCAISVTTAPPAPTTTAPPPATTTPTPPVTTTPPPTEPPVTTPPATSTSAPPVTTTPVVTTTIPPATTTPTPTSARPAC